jgi:hypothetical protein
MINIRIPQFFKRNEFVWSFIYGLIIFVTTVIFLNYKLQNNFDIEFGKNLFVVSLTGLSLALGLIPFLSSKIRQDILKSQNEANKYYEELTNQYKSGISPDAKDIKDIKNKFNSYTSAYLSVTQYNAILFRLLTMLCIIFISSFISNLLDNKEILVLSVICLIFFIIDIFKMSFLFLNENDKNIEGLKNSIQIYLDNIIPGK